MKIIHRIASIVLAIGITGLAGFAQQPAVKGWHLLDKRQDGYQGISLQKALDFLANKKATTVAVAVLDGGVDTTHMALKSRLWYNNKEVACNGIDDDGNGYPDDYFGWNFLGSPNGTNVEKEASEAARLYTELKPRFEGSSAKEVAPDEQHLFQLWQQVNQAISLTPEDKFTLKVVKATYKSMSVYDSVIQAQWSKPEYAAIELDHFLPETPEGKKAKMGLLRILDMMQFDKEKTNHQIFEEIEEFIDQKEELIELAEMQKPVVCYRYTITGDNPNDFSNKEYGNADVMGPASMHGTHIAGIIAAEENVQPGIRGIASNARIMSVRMVPRGDEYDKDVALGIRYAVDNGAKIINMSFGKEVSPHKKWVDDAVCYAAAHDVLLVHAAGNDGRNLDEGDQYPSPTVYEFNKAENVIRVGASSDPAIDGKMVAGFTNYGKLTVDVLAPGVKIYSTVNSGTGFGFQQGTSMSAPVVSGIAALIRGYYPNLTAAEVKQIIEGSVDTSYRHQLVNKPDGDKKDKLLMENICSSAGIVNAYNAVRMADEWSRKKKSRH